MGEVLDDRAWSHGQWGDLGWTNREKSVLCRADRWPATESQLSSTKP